MNIDLQRIMSNVDLQSRSLITKKHKRDTILKRAKYLAFCYLRQTEKSPKYATNSKKLPKLPNKLPNEF